MSNDQMRTESDDKLKRMHGLRGIVADLRDRKVFRSAVAYIVAAWLIVQVADIVLPAFEAPPWILRAVITALIMGLPLAVFLAWLYDITPSGIVRRSAPQVQDPWSSRWRLAAAALAILVTGGALSILWSGYAGTSAPVISRATPPLQPVVAVPALTNLSGDPSLEWLGEGLANLLRDGLTESPHVIVVSPARWRSIARPADGANDVPELAASAGIHYVVSGEILEAPAGLLLTTRLTDLVNGVEMQGQRITGESAQDLLAAVSSLVLLIKRGMNVPHTEQVDWFAADFAVDNVAAYEAYLSGLAFFLDFSYTKAAQAFRAALDLAPDFHMARYRLAQVLAATGHTDAAAETLDAIPTDALLGERERAYVEGAKALFARDADRAQEIFKSLLEEHPYDVEGRLLLAQAFDLAYDDAAALAELERLARQEPENERIWSFIGETNLRMGQHEAARAALARYLELEPSDPYGFTILAQVELASGNYEAAVQRLQRALSLAPEFPRARLALGQVQALRGDFEAAGTTLTGLAYDGAVPPGDRIDAAFDLASVLRASGRFEEALKPLVQLEELIVAEQIRAAMALAMRGSITLELGDPESAERLIGLAIERSPGVPTRYLYARGQLELARGDLESVRATVRAIRSHALPPDDPDRTEERAASYLEGMAALSSGQVTQALLLLRAAVTLEGYRYGVYELGLARALYRAEATNEALELAVRAAADRDPAEVRLDLELERGYALLLAAKIAAAAGEERRSRMLAQRFLERWRHAPASRAEVEAARTLAGPKPPTSG